MLDDKDIKKLIDVFATRDEIKEMVGNLVTKEEFSDLQAAVDAYAKKPTKPSGLDFCFKI